MPCRRTAKPSSGLEMIDASATAARAREMFRRPFLILEQEKK
jgi:hypothetical protein